MAINSFLRGFGVLGFWGTSNVNMDGVLERLQSINNKYEFIYEGGCDPNDCFVAYVK